VRGLVEGLLLAAYRYSLAAGAEPPKLRRIDVDTEQDHAAEAVTAQAVAEATWLARDLVNTPSSLKSPEWLAAAAVKAAGAHGVTATVREPDRLAAEGFGGLLAVGGGSVRGPRLVELKWAPRRASQHVVLVGKGITFDTGGISIKPGPGMGLMKKDMGGAAAVLGAVLGAAALRLPVKVTALLAVAENMPSGSAYRPGDVVRHHGGKTSEVLNTDAEGRLVLADALAYAAARLRPDALVDLATLTGAQSVALGKRTAALFSDSDELAEALARAADEAGERVWRMPLPDDYLDTIRSDVADVNNAAGNPGTVTAALYLREFTGAAADRWAHLDMSGPAWSDKADGELARGGTGWGVRTLVRWLQGVAVA
jgi:leucyl aminopeptidase